MDTALGWKGKKDRFVLPDAHRRGYHALPTHDSAQLDSLALAVAAVMAAIRPVVQELDSADRQLLVEIQGIRAGRRHVTTDPRVDPPPYWPSRGGQARGSHSRGGRR